MVKGTLLELNSSKNVIVKHTIYLAIRKPSLSWSFCFSLEFLFFLALDWYNNIAICKTFFPVTRAISLNYWIVLVQIPVLPRVEEGVDIVGGTFPFSNAAQSNLSCCIWPTSNPVAVMPTLLAASTNDSWETHLLQIPPKMIIKVSLLSLYRYKKVILDFPVFTV